MPLAARGTERSMDRNSLARIVLIAALIFGGYMLFFGKKSNSQGQLLPRETYVNAPGFAPDVIDAEPGQSKLAPPPEGEICGISGVRFRAELSSRGAGLTHFFLSDRPYASDMSTTPDIERWRSLRTEFRPNPSAPPSPDDQVAYDRFEWKMAHLGDTGCVFTYEDDRARIVKTVKAGARPFELAVET